LRAALLFLIAIVAAGALSTPEPTDVANSTFAQGTPLWVLGFAAVILVTFLAIPLTAAASSFGAKPSASRGGIELFSLPGSRLQKVKADALIVFADETGWLGHGTSKYVKDKGDYGLDDRIRDAGPISPGKAKSFKVGRLPVSSLIVANIFDDRKLVTKESFRRGFGAAAKAAEGLGCESVAFFDPTDDWNYFTHRIDAATTADMVLDTVSSFGNLRAVKVIIPNEENLASYKDRLKA
jgi:hypothetical protein